MSNSTETAPLLSIDLQGQLAGITEGSALAELRAQRPEIIRHTQGSYEALFEPADVGGLSRTERDLIGLRVATLTGTPELAAWHRERLQQAGVDADVIAAIEQYPNGNALSERQTVLLAHVQRVALSAVRSQPEDLDALKAVGFGPREIVTLSQVIAFLSYQARTLIGLRLLGATL